MTVACVKVRNLSHLILKMEARVIHLKQYGDTVYADVTVYDGINIIFHNSEYPLFIIKE